MYLKADLLDSVQRDSASAERCVYGKIFTLDKILPEPSLWSCAPPVSDDISPNFKQPLTFVIVCAPRYWGWRKLGLEESSEIQPRGVCYLACYAYGIRQRSHASAL